MSPIYTEGASHLDQLVFGPPEKAATHMHSAGAEALDTSL